MEVYHNWLLGLNLGDSTIHVIESITGILLILLVSLLANLLAKKLILSMVTMVIRKSRVQWDDVFLDSGVFSRLSHIAPAIVINWLVPLFFSRDPEVLRFTHIAVNIYLISIVLWVIDAILNAVLTIYDRFERAKRLPLKGFIQAVKLVINLMGLILILSIAFGKSPVYFFSGLGAITAVLLLIFRDAILGFVAGIQISVNNMVQKGDWIEMPKHSADGDVLDVSLTTVKVQNWDKTITTIPTYALISESFRNWRGMSESGGRRIKRSLNIDVNSIRFADETLLERFKRYKLLRPYLEDKLEELQKHNANVGDDLQELINGRHLTNVGTFRAYCVAYLRAHPKVHQEMTLLVRQLKPDEHGLPIEIYCFSNDTAWANYECIQADIFDHLLAVLNHFDLRVYQQPSGKDLELLVSKG